MSPINNFGILAFATAVLAIPHVHHHKHMHLHAREAPGAYGESSAPADPASSAAPASGSSYAPVSYSAGNSSYPYGPTGTGWGTGYFSYKPTGYPSASSGAPVGYPSGSSAAPVGYPSGSASASYCASASTTTCIWRDHTSVSTIVAGPTDPAGYPSAPPAPAASAAPAGGEGCSPDVTVTEKVTQTVTVTAGGYGGSSAAPVDSSSAPAAPSYGADAKYGGPWGWGSADPVASSSSSAAPVMSAPAYSDPASSSAPVKSAPAYSNPASSAAPVNSAPAYSDPASSAAPVNSAPAYSDPASSAAPAEGSSAAAPSYGAQPTGRASGGAFSSKRGIAYNDLNAAKVMSDSSNMGWAYNWITQSSGFSGSQPYIPTLHDTSEPFTSVWMLDAKAAISNGAQYLFSFNEPDMPSQANLSPQAAASAWKQYMEPFAGQVSLVAPSVSNSGSAGQGLDWLKQFMAACSDCTIDAVNVHWYDYTSNDIESFKNQVSGAATQSGKPVFVSEFAFIGSDSDISDAMNEVMGWMDSTESVLAYAYFMCKDGMLVNGDQASSYGETYMS